MKSEECFIIGFLIGLLIMLSSLYARGELIACTHKNGTAVTITSGPNKGKTGIITLREQYLGEMHHRIELTEVVSVTEDELQAGTAKPETEEEKTKRLIEEDKFR